MKTLETQQISAAPRDLDGGGATVADWTALAKSPDVLHFAQGGGSAAAGALLLLLLMFAVVLYLGTTTR